MVCSSIEARTFTTKICCSRRFVCMGCGDTNELICSVELERWAANAGVWAIRQEQRFSRWGLSPLLEQLIHLTQLWEGCHEGRQGEQCLEVDHFGG